MSESINHIVLSTGSDKLESKKIRSVNPPNRHNIISWSMQRFPSRIETELDAGGKAGNEDFSSWSMHMASMGLYLQCHGAGTRSGVRTCVGGTRPMLVTAPISNGRGECSGTWEKSKESYSYEAVPIKLLCGQEVSPMSDLEQVTQSLHASTLNVTADYKEVCQLSKATLVLQFHGHAVVHGHWPYYQANRQFFIGLLGWPLKQRFH